MYNIIMRYEKLKENFDVYGTNETYNNYEVFSIVIKNNDMEQYINNIKCYCYERDVKDNFVVYEKNRIKIVFDKITEYPQYFYDGEIIIFEFSDEEEAFYFKLKYAS